MTPTNLIIIMADEHNPKVMGCAGHPNVRTPNLDGLAARGTRFTAAYTNSPICIPARAAFATGRYVHETGNWDNAFPYHGEVRSWTHDVRDSGLDVVSIGKLHYRNAEDDTGFSRQVNPMHVVGGEGDVLGAVRDPLPVREKCRTLSEELGPGDTPYIRYDREIAEQAADWLMTAGRSTSQSPWVLFVSFVCPHFPLVAPPEFFDLYDPTTLDLPKAADIDSAKHPWVNDLRNCFIYDNFFDDDKRRLALASYYGLCSFADSNVGQVLAAVGQAGLEPTTRVIYLSDHGDNLGSRGLWGKSTLFEESAGVPMVMAGPDVPQGHVVDTPVSLVDIHPTVLETMGLEIEDERESLPGLSLLDVAAAGDRLNGRAVFSEYHAAGSSSGAFMIRKNNFKLIEYVGHGPQLFDLEVDPEETLNLAGKGELTDVLADLRQELHRLVEPNVVDARAKGDQAKLIKHHGGREAVVSRGTFGPTPAPGEQVRYTSATA